MRKIIIIMTLALIASTAVSAPRTGKKWHWNLQKVEQGGSYGFTAEEVLKMFIEGTEDIVPTCTEATASIEDELERETMRLELMLDSQESLWKVYKEAFGDTLRKDPRVWSAFLTIGEEITRLKRESAPKIEAAKRLIYNY